ncbi:MAG: peptidylprolyl isomerase [Gammaproteobacteria bacterium]|nr:peptidylprolyl isomerase [Gammaproteobacteria bacterium]
MTKKLLLGLLLATFVLPSQAEEYVRFETTDGDVYIELFDEEAPLSVENFKQYVKDGFYDGTIFHRVIAGFVAQGGGYDIDFDKKETREPVKNESTNGLSNERGTLAMARTNEPDSATSQFYINLVDNDRLDAKEYRPGYTVFGKVVRGMNVIDSIAELPVGPAGPFGQNVPMRPVIIEKAELVAALPAEAGQDSSQD